MSFPFIFLKGKKFCEFLNILMIINKILQNKKTKKKKIFFVKET
jgi:hypothetical protein